MDLRIGRRRTALTGPQSPNTTNAGGSTNNNPCGVGGAFSSNGGAQQNSNNGGGRTKSRLLPMSRNNSLSAPPPPAWKSTGLASGTHIRRRPPSVPGRTASPLQARPAVTRLKKEIIEHRSDPSPAPSRPPRTFTKHSLAASPPLLSLNPLTGLRGMMDHQRITSAFYHGNDRGKLFTLNRPAKTNRRNPIIPDSGTATPSSPVSGSRGVGRRNIVLDVKQGSRPVTERKHMLEALPQAIRTAAEDTVRSYKELCEALGQAPQDAWIDAVLEGVNKAATSSRTTCIGVGSPAEVKFNAKEREKLAATAGVYLDHGQTKKVGTKTSLTKRPRAVEGKGGGVTPNLCGHSVATRDPSELPAVDMDKDFAGKDTMLDRMVVYCQHLRPYQQKMDVLRQRRKDVEDALGRFLTLCRNCSDPGETSSKLVAVNALESHANLLTDGLKDLQRCNVALLLRLREYSREVRRPLGLVGCELETNAVGQQQVEKKSPGMKENENMTSLFNVPCTEDVASQKKSITFPSTKDPPYAYLNFLREEERRIVQQLNEVCSRVREALTNGLTVTIADEAMLETPLFLSSATTGHPLSFEREHQQQPKRVTGQGFSSCNLVGSGATDNSCRTTPPNSATTEDANTCGPFVGVALVDWVSLADDDDNNIDDHTGSNNSNSCSHKHATGNPKLVLGGGRKCLSFHSPPKRRAGGKVAVRRTKSTSAPNATQKKKNVGKMAMITKTPTTTTTTTATTTTTVKHKKSKTLSKTGSTSSATEAILAVHIKEAEEIWSAIKGLAGVGVARGSFKRQIIRKVSKQKDEENKDFTPELTPQHEQPSEANLFSSTPPKIELEHTTTNKFYGLCPENKLEEEAAQGKTLGVSLASDVSKYNETNKKEPAEVICQFFRLQMQEKKRQINEMQQLQMSTGAPLSLERSAVCKAEFNTDVAMATRIQCCWRQRMARRMLQQRRERVEKEAQQQQKWHIENIMAFRIQRFFAKIVARRRLREATQRRCAASKALQVGAKMAENNRTDGNNEKSSRLMKLRERFEQARERRRNLLRSTPDGTNSFSDSIIHPPCSSSSPLDKALPIEKQPPELEPQPENGVTVKVPPLELKSSGISTFDIEGYQPETENFNVCILHRLLRAPKPLLYMTRVLCDAYPAQPVSALAFLKAAEEAKYKGGGRSSSRQRTTQEKEGKKKEEDKEGKEDKVPSKQQGEDQEIREKNEKGRGEHHQQKMKDESEMRWELRPYRMIRHGLIARKAAMINREDTKHVCPFSIRVKSFVEENEMKHEQPVAKGFQRPFERWGTAHAFQRRVFSAAAEYAWKLIFSHTPHDDYKQRMLKTREEQEARLERVEQRNRMILACYCVRSEREWLKEASKDLGFVARIWNPKKSLDPNDPDFERHCRETYEFVEDFLYQCFPTITNLDEAPTFLMGAGIFFLLKSMLAYNREKEEEDDKTMGDGLAVYVDKIEGRRADPESAAISYLSDILLAPQQQKAISTCEVLNLLDNLTLWCRFPEPRRAVTTASGLGKKNDEVNRNIAHGSMGDDVDFSDTCEGMYERTIQSIEATTRLSDFDTVSFTTSHGESSAKMSEDRRPRLRQVLRTPLLKSSPAKRLDDAAFDARIAHNTNNKKNGLELEIVYPKGYLVGLSERLMRAILGLRVELEVCEDLDATI
ncbi:hypothetical protein C4B63_95g43 [Trypanosoma cruzi]|uniref:Uncharacterized protein n=1 Tax=Trypanosoma cruzi TaxID=5693 RepID=A0A2V2USX5_TRYCR|nr:hypothetical protein C4B63_95g43 [Trypanosoma cruzi]